MEEYDPEEGQLIPQRKVLENLIEQSLPYMEP
jgi:hypothetical protein